MAKLAGAEWKEMSAEDKAEWNEKAKEDKVCSAVHLGDSSRIFISARARDHHSTCIHLTCLCIHLTHIHQARYERELAAYEAAKRVAAADDDVSSDSDDGAAAADSDSD